MIPPCLTLSNIKYVSWVKWSNPGKGVAPSPTLWCSSHWKGSLLVTLNYGHQLYLLILLVTLYKPLTKSPSQRRWVPYDVMNIRILASKLSLFSYSIEKKVIFWLNNCWQIITRIQNKEILYLNPVQLLKLKTE